MKINYNLKKYNTFNIDIKCSKFLEINSSDDIQQLHKYASKNNDYIILGGGSNFLFTTDYNGLVAFVALKGKSVINEDSDYYYIQAQAGENWHDFVLWTIENGFSGLENLSLIPGTVGASPMQNIGAYGVEVKDVIHNLEAVDLKSGLTKIFTNTECKFSYRDSIFKSKDLGRYLITNVTFKLPKKPVWKTAYADIQSQLKDNELSSKVISDAIIKTRQNKLPDPNKVGNAGSFFKNPILTKDQMSALLEIDNTAPSYEYSDTLYKTSAGWLIDKCGLKGYTKGNAGIYHKHALVLVNNGAATGDEINNIAKHIINEVQQKYSIKLEPEPRII